jgi:hypothetical protein
MRDITSERLAWVKTSGMALAVLVAGSVSVMILAGDDHHLVVGYLVNQTMLMVDTTGPAALQFVLQSLGLASAFKR